MHKCFFDCGAWFETKYWLEVYGGWDWFTGYAKEAMHFCPRCRKERIADIDNIRRQANVRPKNYPREHAEIVMP